MCLLSASTKLKIDEEREIIETIAKSSYSYFESHRNEENNE